MHLVLRIEVVVGREVVVVERGHERGRLHAEDVHRPDLGKARHQVGTDDPAPPSRFVDHDGTGGELAGVAGAGIHHAVLDHHGRCEAVVPEQLIEKGDVCNRNIATFGEDMPLGAWFFVRSVVLQVDRRQVPSRHTAEPVADQLQF